MDKKYSLFILLAVLFSGNVFAQDLGAYKEEKAYQKRLMLQEPAQAEAAIAQFGKMYNLDKESTFEGKKITTDNSGYSHQRYQQFYKGVKVEFGTVITHSRDGKVVSVNGELYNPKNLNLTPRLTPQEGLQIAVNGTPAQKYLWEDAAASAAMDYKKPQGELVVFPKVVSGEMKLAYKYDVYALEPVSREEIFVDAQSGEILFRNAIIKHAHNLLSVKESEQIVNKFEAFVSGTAATRYSGSRSIETSFDNTVSKYVLNDITRGNGIVTYNCGKTNTRPSVNFEDADNNWTAAEFNNANKDNAALDAHWGAEMTYDFWKNVFNRNSFDDAGGKIKSYVHFDDVPGGAGWNNANWNGSVMTYGDGTTNPLTTLDICGHEIGHGVCTYTANLAYQNQSGALNEGFSDIWGTCIEQYGRTGNLNAPVDTASPGTQAVWKIGEDLGTSLRSMSYPRTKNNPDTFLGQYYSTTGDDGSCTPTQGNDYCGVHNNSGVLNHWFYILTAGKSGTNNATVVADRDTYNVTGIGMTKSSQIAYFAERDYLTPNSTFFDARQATIDVATLLYCGTSPEVVAVTNAWNAVNVGDKFVGLPNDVALKSITNNVNLSCATSVPSIVFENSGTSNITSVTVTYSIDGGANIVNTWTGNLANCSTVSYPLTVGNLSRGTHTLSVTTNITGDLNPINNSKAAVITVNNSGMVNSINTFESATDELIGVDASGLASTVWERGTSTKGQLTDDVAGHSKVYATRLNEMYPDATKSYLVSQCYDLSGTLNPTLRFDMAYDLETNWDVLYMEYSINGGASWNILGTAADANWYTSSGVPNGTNCNLCVGKQWTGEFSLAHPAGGINGAKRQYSQSLANFGSGSGSPQSSIIFRFVFHSDENSSEDGAIIDNFVIEGALSTAENQFENFGVYPNPSNGLFNVVLSTSEKVSISLYDMRGRSIYNETFSSNGAVFNKELNFKTLTSGVYILNVESAGKKASKRIIIN